MLSTWKLLLATKEYSLTNTVTNKKTRISEEEGVQAQCTLCPRSDRFLIVQTQDTLPDKRGPHQPKRESSTN